MNSNILYKQIKYNRLVIDFENILDSLSIKKSGLGEYYKHDGCEFFSRLDIHRMIIINFENIHSYNFPLSDNYIASLIHEKYNDCNYRVIMKYGHGENYKDINKIFVYGKAN